MVKLNLFDEKWVFLLELGKYREKLKLNYEFKEVFFDILVEKFVKGIKFVCEKDKNVVVVGGVGGVLWEERYVFNLYGFDVF